MDTLSKIILWSQFGAAIDMLDNDVRACLDELLEGPGWVGKARS